MHEIFQAIEWLRDTSEEAKEAKERIINLAIQYGCDAKLLNNDFRGARLFLEGYRDGWRSRKDPK